MTVLQAVVQQAPHVRPMQSTWTQEETRRDAWTPINSPREHLPSLAAAEELPSSLNHADLFPGLQTASAESMPTTPQQPQQEASIPKLEPPRLEGFAQDSPSPRDYSLSTWPKLQPRKL